MDIRTFEAFSIKDAVRSVKRALGNDAVILSTRQKPSETGKGTVFEVTAAAHTTERPGAAARATAQSDGVGDELVQLSARLTSLADQSPSKRQVEALETGLKEVKLLLLETLRGKDGSPLKDLPNALVPVERQLRVMGVADEFIAELIRHLCNLPTPNADGDEDGANFFKDHALRFMMKRIKIAPRWTLVPGAQSQHVLVGPPGAGKTSLVAKLAAHYHTRERTKALVVSFDNHRLAAAEQMRVFCKVLGVPFAAINDPADLAPTLDAHKDAEMVLVDSAGVSVRSGAGIETLKRLKSGTTAGLPVEFHLCLSITEKESQLEQAVKAFAPLGLASLAFTKIDDCWSFGEMYNVSRRWGIPLSFFSTGQEIPADLERATRERVVERIFGL